MAKSTSAQFLKYMWEDRAHCVVVVFFFYKEGWQENAAISLFSNINVYFLCIALPEKLGCNFLYNKIFNITASNFVLWENVQPAIIKIFRLILLFMFSCRIITLTNWLKMRERQKEDDFVIFIHEFTPISYYQEQSKYHNQRTSNQFIFIS